ncbi:MAG: CBS domain-containing protein [Desulfovibrio sp.]|jgi:tRNA nucleotidyltransferase (CCA-adding enzyme)|nr:CBS domain-containing protein [Desulfovibrio sp.]
MNERPTLITCHANADFDAFAAMLAARHLYAPCELYFPGSQERSLQKVYADLNKKEYGFVEGTPAWDKYGRLVLVDTRQHSRVRHVEALLARADVRVVVWDHHPDSVDDISPDEINTAKIGAVTALLARELQNRGIGLDTEEATLMGLGVYSDTGSFTYSSTTADDFLAAVWLLGQGMSVRRVSEMASHELTSLHIQTLNRLLESAQTYVIDNIPVVLAEVSLEHYLGDFATLAQKLMEMEKISVLFAIGLMGDRVQIVARSHNEALDVGRVCSSLGGGGHSYAASASLRDKTLTEARESILRILREVDKPAKTARDYMTTPAICVNSLTSLREANELMLHYGLKAVPVCRHGNQNCIGLLDAQMASRAVAHGLSVEPVKEYMQRYIRTIPPSAALRELSDIIVGERQRLVPVVEKENVIGVVTRTDLIALFANEPSLLAPGGHSPKKRNVAKYLRDRLSAETRDILALAGKIGTALGLPVYAVGGFVRDVLMGRATQDIDLVVEGNGIALARELAGLLSGRVREHQKFLTSVVVYHNGKGEEARIDVATARLEYYEYPAALPTVELSSLKMDLYRRDFSINALAVRLDGDNYGDLADFFGGWQDIKDHLIRVLHTLSFVEDPTRCLRAVRFEQRYAFRMGLGTEKLMKNALAMKMMERLSPARLFNEYKHICEEENPPACFARLHETGVLSAIESRLSLSPQKTARLAQIKETLAWYAMLYFQEKVQAWLVYFYGLTADLQYKDASAAYDGLGLPEIKKHEIMKNREKLRRIRTPLLHWQEKLDAGRTKVSGLCELLRDLPLECLLFLMACVDIEGVKKTLSHYITKWRREKADVTGDDLRRLGLAPGPAFGNILGAILAAKLDGTAVSVESQFRLAQKLVRAEIRHLDTSQS